MTAAAPKRVVLLGATGSIGDSTLKVIRAHPDKLQLVGVAARQNAAKLAAIAREFSVPRACLSDETAYRQARDQNTFADSPAALLGGAAGLSELAALPEADIVLVAVVGTDGLLPALAALKAGKDLAVASKEILALAGKFVVREAKLQNARILPVDSEHNAIFQCLEGARPEHVAKIILTASGGSFRDLPLDQFAKVTVEQALRHPNWDMGPKVTIDSATMANKGLEMIEARWLFNLAPSQIDVAIHPQSIVHSLAQFIDGSVLAQLCPPDMTFAIQHALLYPDRGPGVAPPLDFAKAMSLDFRPVEAARYPCLGLARRAMEACGVAPGVFNAANEIAVEAFVAGRHRFVDIPRVIEKTLDAVDNIEPVSLEEVLSYDAEARRLARSFIR